MGCYNCKYLKEDKKAAGKVNGSLYYCCKLKKYVSGASAGCDNYNYDYSRNSITKNEIYNAGKHYYNDDMPIANYIVILVLLIIFGIILSIYN